MLLHNHWMKDDLTSSQVYDPKPCSTEFHPMPITLGLKAISFFLYNTIVFCVNDTSQAKCHKFSQHSPNLLPMAHKYKYRKCSENVSFSSTRSPPTPPTYPLMNATFPSRSSDTRVSKEAPAVLSHIDNPSPLSIPDLSLHSGECI